MSTAVTYFPHLSRYVSGDHESVPYNAPLLAKTDFTENKSTDKVRLDAKTLKVNTTPLSAKIKKLASLIAKNKEKIMLGQLSAVDFEAGRENLDHLILIRLYNQLMGEQYRWFHLDEMFNGINVDKLLLRMSFRDNPAVAQKVPRRKQYDTTKVEYDEISLALEKIVVSYDMPIEDPLRALIDPVLPLQQSNEYSMAYYRENEAKAALNQLKYHYRKDATGGAKFTPTRAPTDNNTQRISNPNTLAAGNVHSDYKVVNEIQDMRNAFMEEFDAILTHFACSPRTAMQLAQNTWTEPNTIFNVEAYRTNGGVRPFPGLSDATMVISQVLDDSVLYAASKPNNVLIKAEGPKITKTWEDNSRWTMQTATADFHQYKCAHEDLTFDRKFGVIVDLHTG